jgi:hypothetical protein
MSEPAKNANLVETKLTLAKKYENLASLTPSKPKRKRFLYHAARFRRQAADLSRAG